MSRNDRAMRLKGAAINAVIDLSLQRAKDGVAMGVIADKKHGVLWAIYTLISAAATLGCRAGLSSADMAEILSDCAKREADGTSHQDGKKIAEAGEPS